MPTMVSFNEDQIKEIYKYFYIDCEMIHDDSISLKKKMMICPIHKMKHERLPDADTFRVLVEMYPAYTMQAWADVFKTTREAVRILYKKTFGTDMGRDRQISLYGESPDFEKIKEYTDIVANKPHVAMKSVFAFVDVNENYVQYWKIRNQEVADMFDEAIKTREHKLDNPETLKCYRCKLTLPVADFHNSEKTRHGYSRTCKECSIAQVSAYYEKRKEEYDPTKIASEKKCTSCKVVKHRRYFDLSKGQSGGLQSNCRQCMERFQMSNKKRKQKFKDFDLAINKECKTEDCTTVEYWNYYLVRPNPQHRPHVTDYCRLCIKEVGTKFENAQSFINKYRWDCAYYKDNQKSPEEFYEIYIGLKEKKPKPQGRPRKNWNWADFVEAYGEEEE